MYYESKMSTPLNHYGVLGMRWGIRHDKDGLFSRKSTRTTRGLEYRLKKDEKRIAKGKEAKFNTEKLKKDLAASKAEDKKLHNYVSKKSTGKILLQTLCFGSRGALRYNQMRNNGSGRMVAALGSRLAVNARLNGLGPTAAIVQTAYTDYKYRS